MGYEIPTCQMQHDAADKKHLNKIQASYTLEGTVLENVDNIKYLGVTITNPNSFLLPPRCEGSSL